MFFIVLLLWLFIATKYVFFWLYLWQLKDYHIPRFLDHFNTEKGKRLIFNPLLVSKLAFLLLFFISRIAFTYALILLYVVESAFFLRSLLKKRARMPQFTFKAIVLSAISVFVVALYPIVLSFYVKETQVYYKDLLIFDILLPVVISAIVLFFQPISVSLRNRILWQAKNKIKNFKNLTVIAITGSYGKTATKEFLSTILAQKFNVLKTRDHQNSEIGIATCILKDLKPGHEIFVVEMGAYAKGGIKLLANMVNPKIGIVAGVNEQHLGLFGSMENLLSAEGGRELANSLANNKGFIVLNGENRHCLDLYRKVAFDKAVYAESTSKVDADIWAEDVSVEKNGISFVVINKNKETAHFDVAVLGKQNVQNLLGATVVAQKLGMSLQEISKACKKIIQDQAGMTVKKGRHGIFVIDSSYSSNPDGVYADLNYLGVYENKKVIVMPCLIELGERSKEIHYKIGEQIAKICDAAIITTKDKFQEIQKGAIDSGMSANDIKFCENPQDIATMISLICTENDAVLLEGRVPVSLIKTLSE